MICSVTACYFSVSVYGCNFTRAKNMYALLGVMKACYTSNISVFVFLQAHPRTNSVM